MTTKCDLGELITAMVTPFDSEKAVDYKSLEKVAAHLIEQKTDTIGSEHPFIIRNGNLKYKEFSIGGLISYIMDESEQMFMTLDELGIAHRSTDLTTDNIVAERHFKLSVLDWLTNGKAKIFRSPKTTISHKNADFS